MKSSAKAEAEMLMNDGIVFAAQMLREYGEFHPFARVLDAGDSMGHVTDVFFPYEIHANEVSLGDLFATPRSATIYVTEES